MIKKLTSIILLFVFSYSFLGAGFVYNIWLYTLKKEVKQELKQKFGKEETVVIKVPRSWEEQPPEYFQWHEDHEFWYQGKMYDILEKEYHGDEVWYYSYWDRAETELLNHFTDYVSRYLTQQPDRDKQNTTLQVAISKIFLFVQFIIHFELAPIAEQLPAYWYTHSNIYLDIDLPPPRIVSLL
jgi:hypothetical protein